jgi:hypothetical protein
VPMIPWAASPVRWSATKSTTKDRGRSLRLFAKHPIAQMSGH